VVDKPQFYNDVSVTAFYIVCYNSLTTHPSQSTYTINEFQKRKRTRNKGGQTKKEKRKKNQHERKKETQTHSPYKTNHKIHHNNKHMNNYDPSIHYQHTNTSLQITFHFLNTLQQDNAHSKNKTRQNKT